MEPTVDILKYLGTNKKEDEFVVGFALETNNEEENAKGKLKNKNCDLSVWNSLNNSGAGFGGETNKVTIFDRDNNKVEFELKSKQKVASDILNTIEAKYPH